MAIAAIIPLAFDLTLALSGRDILFGTGDSDKYYKPALRLLETGRFSYIDTTTGVRVPDLDQLPVYPIFLYAVFRAFGSGAFWMAALLQTLLWGLTVVAIALAARSFHRQWTWPAALLASAWPNLAFRPSTILTETVFSFLFAWALCALLWIPRVRIPALAATGAGVALGLAHMTRPVLLLFPYLAGPVLMMMLRRDAGLSWRASVSLAVLPMVIMFAFSLPNYVQAYQAYGAPLFTIQKGINVRDYLYPCLAANWGCGDPDQTAADRALREYREAVALLPTAERNNAVFQDQVAIDVAERLIAELGMVRVAKGIIGSTAKLMLHTSAYEILQRFNAPVEYFGRMPGTGAWAKGTAFLRVTVTSPPMLLWAVFQATLLVSRLIQLLGMWHLVADPARRWRGILLFAGMTAILGVSIGFGNPRYRVPLEPSLILLTVAGLAAMGRFVRTDGAATAAPTSQQRSVV